RFGVVVYPNSRGAGLPFNSFTITSTFTIADIIDFYVTTSLLRSPSPTPLTFDLILGTSKAAKRPAGVISLPHRQTHYASAASDEDFISGLTLTLHHGQHLQFLHYLFVARQVQSPRGRTTVRRVGVHLPWFNHHALLGGQLRTPRDRVHPE
ncbi:hypothetical protein FPV67DRAFT_1474667, partial [Lyophyllum atratum]